MLAPLLLIATLGGFLTPHPAHTWAALQSLWIGAGCLVVWSVALHASRLRRLLDLSLVPAFLLSLLALAQATGLFQPFQFAATGEGRRAAITSLAGNTGDLAMVLVIPSLLAQLWLLRRRRSPWRWALVALLFAAMVATETFVPLGAALVGSLVLWSRLSWRRLATMAVFLSLSLAVLVATTPLGDRLHRKQQQVRKGAVNAFLSGRADGWNAALVMLGERPWSGVGHGAYRAEFGRAKLEGIAEGQEYFEHHVFAFFANAHCEPLEVAAEWGWPGVAALGWALALLVTRLRRRGEARSPERALGWGGFVGLGLLSLANFPFRVALVGYPAVLWLAWALAQNEADP
jgi:hypothetical protein